jgi:hypothetical protein
VIHCKMSVFSALLASFRLVQQMFPLMIPALRFGLLPLQMLQMCVPNVQTDINAMADLQFGTPTFKLSLGASRFFENGSPSRRPEALICFVQFKVNER